MAYRLGSMETFMHMVESGKGITFIPELAVMQLSEEQRELVRPFAIPRPTRQIVLVTRKDFIRTSLLQVLKEEIQAAVRRIVIPEYPELHLSVSIGGVCGVHPLADAIRAADLRMYEDKKQCSKEDER